MELFEDISNRQSKSKPQGVLKTFERRRLQALSEEAPTPSSVATSPSSCHASPGADSVSPSSPSRLCASSAHPSTRAGGLSKHGRRSSVLRAAALPGHQLFSSHVSTSRSLLLAKMSKARRKAYLAYTQQMAEYFAQVDEFELLEESPAAAMEKQARSKLPRGAASDARPTPVADDQFTRYGALAASPAMVKTVQQLAAPPDSAAAATICSSLTYAEVSPLGDSQSLQASPSSPQADAQSAELLAATPQVAATPANGPATGVPVSQSRSQQQLQLQVRTAGASSSLAGPLLAESPVLGANAFDAQTPDAPAEARSTVGVNYQADVSAAPQQSPSSPGSPAGSCLSEPQDAILGMLPSINSRLSGLSLEASTPARGGMLAVSDAVHLEEEDQAPTADSFSELSAALTASPIVSSPGPQQGRCAAQPSLAASTPATAQQADLQQMVHQMQHMWLATTPDSAEANQQGSRVPSQQLQVQHAAHSWASDTPEGVLLQGKQQVACTQQRHEHIDHSGPTRVPHEELQRQQQEQQQLAEQHYTAWLQQQAEAAAVCELQQLELAATAAAELTPLQQMLQACGQSDIPSMRDFLADLVDLRDVAKIGEGTYGEAFKSGQIVLKFVPMEGSNLINGWPQKGAGDLLAEAIIALALSDLAQELDESGVPHASYTDAFVRTHRVGVCQGPYPAPFIKAWKAWDKRHKSENDPIAGLPDHQLYAVFAMANCGRDLESYCLQGYEQVRSLMLQTALALAVAEEAVAFEHRDLHWGNIMLSPAQDTHITARLKGCSIRVHAVGVRVRLIDFTASRLQTPGGDVVFCDLEAEDGLFDGPKGKPQFETYRRMRKLTRKDWTGSYPGTNVLWLVYLTELLLSSEKPIPGVTAAQKRNLREFKKRLSSYNCCSDVIWDELFEGLWAAA